VHRSVTLIGALSQLFLWMARTILKALAVLSHALTMRLSRQAEFDADLRSARIVGSEPVSNALQQMPYLEAAGSLAMQQAAQSWRKRVLSDDLVIIMAHLQKNLPGEVKTALTNRVLTADSTWHDSHPPLFKRVAALKKHGLQGVLKIDADATCLFRDFDELCKMATIDAYQSIVGKALKPEHLVPVTLAR
jgi:Zn-dependent protease with chaperone function